MKTLFPGVEGPTQDVDTQPGNPDDEIDENATPRGDEPSRCKHGTTGCGAECKR
jgi:hypothetical protein